MSAASLLSSRLQSSLQHTYTDSHLACPPKHTDTPLCRQVSCTLGGVWPPELCHGEFCCCQALGVNSHGSQDLQFG